MQNVNYDKIGRINVIRRGYELRKLWWYLAIRMMQWRN